MDMEERIRALEIQAAVMNSQLTAIVTAVNNNTAAQERMAAIFEQAKGGKVVGLGVIVFIGFLIDVAFRIFGK